MNEEEEFEFRLRLEREQAQKVAPEEPSDFSFKTMAGNIPSSAAQFAKDITYPIRHPLNTINSLGSLAFGAVDKGAEALGVDVPDNGNVAFNKAREENKAIAEQTAEFAKNRYGSLDAAKQTLMEDPVGMLGDVAAVGTGVGAASKAVLPARASNAIRNVSAALEPTNIATNAVRAPYRAIPQSVKAATTQAAANLLPRHRRRAGVALNQLVGKDAPDIIKALEAQSEIITGNAPTMGQAAAPVGNRKFAAVDRLMSGRKPTAHGRTMDDQRMARVNAIESNIAKTPDEYNKAVKARKDATDPLYEAARMGIKPVKTEPIITKIDKIIRDNPGNKRLVKEMKSLKDGLVDKKGDAFIARTRAKEVVSSIEGLKTTMANQKNAYIKGQLLDMKNDLINAVPSYKQADTAFRELSVPINQMDIGRELAEKIRPIKGDAEGISKFVNAMENSRKTIKDSTGAARYKSLEDVLTPEQMGVLNSVRSEINRDSIMAAHAKQGGKAMRNTLDTALRPLEAPPMLSTKMMIIRKIMSKLKGGATEKTLDYIADRQFSPKEVAAIMKEATPQERAILASPSSMRAQAAVSGALLEAGKSAQENQ